MVSSGADNAHADPIALIPPGVAINNVDAVSGVQVINGTFSVYFPDL